MISFGISRLSMWSLNRDSECGSVFAEVGVQSNTCSGVTRTSLEFTHTISRLPGTSNARAQSAQAVPQVAPAPADNPATSPYPVWQPSVGYVAGYKAVWHHSIYRAKWYSHTQAPTAQLPAQPGIAWKPLYTVPGEPASAAR
jgi:chitinase